MAQALEIFAPSVEWGMRFGPSDWKEIDRIATLASFLLFREPQDEVEKVLNELEILDTYPLDIENYPRHSDVALAAGFRELLIGESTSQSWATTSDMLGLRRQRILAALAEAHQIYFGVVAQSWERLAVLLELLGDAIDFRDRVQRDVANNDQRGENWPIVLFDSDYYTEAEGFPARLDFNLRMIAHFYDRCTVQASRDPTEKLIRELLSLRFSRCLTATETLWDIVVQGTSSMMDPVRGIFSGFGGRWRSSSGRCRIKLHDTSAPTVQRLWPEARHEFVQYNRKLGIIDLQPENVAG